MESFADADIVIAFPPQRDVHLKDDKALEIMLRHQDVNRLQETEAPKPE